MNLEHVRQIQQFSHWVTENLNKSVNFKIDYWNHRNNGEIEIEFRLWIHETLDKRCDDLAELVHAIPRMKEFCLLKEEFSL